MNEHLVWLRMDVPGVELCRLGRTSEGGLELRGRALTTTREGTLLVARYAVACDDLGTTRYAHIEVEHPGGGRRRRTLAADGEGGWHVDGHPAPELAGIRDVDLGVTPATNTLPIRRLALGVGEESTLTAALVKVPSLEVTPLAQRYERLTSDTYRYSSRNGAFRTQLRVDAEGIVTRYPSYWERVA